VAEWAALRAFGWLWKVPAPAVRHAHAGSHGPCANENAPVPHTGERSGSRGASCPMPSRWSTRYSKPVCAMPAAARTV